MSIKLGNTAINKIHLGTTEIKKAFLGTTKVYDKTLPDYTGFHITKLWLPYKTNLATIDYVYRINTNTGSPITNTYVFFDPVNDTSIDSPVDTDTTPGLDTLQDVIDDNSSQGLGVNRWYDQIAGVELQQDDARPELVNTSDVLHTKNGVAAVQFIETMNAFLRKSADGNGFSELDVGNDWSVTLLMARDTDATAALTYGFTTHTTTAKRMSGFLDSRTNKVMGQLRNNTTNYNLTLLAQDATANLRVYTYTFNATTKTLKGYAGGVLQSTQVVTGTVDYNNTAFILGTNPADTGNRNKGPMVGLAIHDEELNATEVSDFYDKLDEKLSF